MAGRVLVTLDGDADTDAVVRRLEAVGGAQVQPPAPELPGVCVVTLAGEHQDPGRWAEEASAVEGVRTAEPDELRWDLGGDVPDGPV